MSIFDFFKQGNTDRGLEEYRATAGGVLLDVRTPGEYREGHIPGSVNLPLQQIDKIGAVVDNTDIPLFVYCRSGARSRQAQSLLEGMGYTRVRDIGGIAGYSGKLER